MPICWKTSRVPSSKNYQVDGRLQLPLAPVETPGRIHPVTAGAGGGKINDGR